MAGVHLNLSQILRFTFKFKEGLKEKMFWNITRLLNAPERAAQVDGQLFGVRLLFF